MKTTDFVIAFESGECTEEEVIEGFQLLLNEGILFQLQGSYGRAGIELLKAGLITLPKDKKTFDYYGNEITLQKIMQ
jgi:hypothetical protein